MEVRALREVDLKIYPGEFVAIVGQSGSGKSTLMNILGCLDRPSAGRYLFAGRDVQSFDADGLAWLRREAFGFVFQSYNLLASETAKENVEVPGIYAGLSAAERAVRAESLLTTLGLGERLDHRPNQLSGGQQQRVSIARALMNGGKVILADEPTGALDSRSGVEVMALLEGARAQGPHSNPDHARCERSQATRIGSSSSPTAASFATAGAAAMRSTRSATRSSPSSS